jgi:hypothetical protein
LQNAWDLSGDRICTGARSWRHNPELPYKPSALQLRLRDPSGAYSAFQDRVDVLLDSSVSKEALAALTRIVEATRDNKISEAEARKQAEAVVPGAGRLFDIPNWSDQAKATLYASIIGAITVIAAAKIASSPSPIVIVQPVIERFVEPPKNREPLPGLPGGPPLKWSSNY